MYLICDDKNEKFIYSESGNEVAQKCVQALNDSVSVQQIINLSYLDVAICLRDREVYFGRGKNTGVVAAVKDALEDLSERIKTEDVYGIFVQIVCGARAEFAEVHAAAEEVYEALPHAMICFGVDGNEALGEYAEAYIIASEKL